VIAATSNSSLQGFRSTMPVLWLISVACPGIPCHPDKRYESQYPRIDDDWLAAPYAPDYEHTYVYFIAESCGPIKVGYATRPHERLASIQTGNCRRLFLLSYVEAPREAERRLHERLDAHRISGEWYAPEVEVFDAIDACERVFGASHRLECDQCRREQVAVERGLDIPWGAHLCGAWGRSPAESGTAV
jgi:hypothetical protein